MRTIGAELKQRNEMLYKQYEYRYVYVHRETAANQRDIINIVCKKITKQKIDVILKFKTDIDDREKKTKQKISLIIYFSLKSLLGQN